MRAEKEGIIRSEGQTGSEGFEDRPEAQELPEQIGAKDENGKDENEKRVKQARLYAMKQLQSRDRTEKDLRIKLLGAGYGEELTDDAISYVKDFGYLDDVRFAFNYIRFSSQRMSRLTLSHKLSEKGISGEDIEKAFCQAYEEGFIDDLTEEETLERLIRKKYPSGGELSENERNKLFASMYRKGFAVSKVEKVLRRILT